MIKNVIGFVGVGRMGANMARRLADTGYPVGAVYDPNQDAAASLAEELGCLAAATLSQVTAACDVIFTVVTDDEAMRQIFSDSPQSLLAGAADRTFINCATVSPAAHEAAAEAAARAGAETLAASMASSIPQARQGTLYLMVGGKTEVFERMKPLLTDLSAALRHVGPVGHAAKIKALVNMVMNINTAALAEGLGLGEALGLDLGMLREVFSQTGANSRVLATDGEDMVNRDHACFFSAQHAAKDSGIALSLAAKERLQLPLATATLAQFQRMVDAGLGHLDKSGIAELTFKGRGPKAPRKASKPTKK